MSVITEKKKKPKVGRKARQPDATSQDWWEKLGRLVETHRRGRTNSEIAQAAGISANHFNMILRGESKSASFAKIDRIVKALPATWAAYDRA
jgi:transcriptional regulator with XRE-family HTH domain